MKLTFDSSKPITGEASAIIEVDPEEVFYFIADNFFENYPKWAPDVVELQALEGNQVRVGAKGRQVREDADSIVESTFEVTAYDPNNLFVFQSFNPPYKHTYSTEAEAKGKHTKLTFRFELFEIDIFMRPFAKLIRVAIEDGAESTVEKIKELLMSSRVEVA